MNPDLINPINITEAQRPKLEAYLKERMEPIPEAGCWLWTSYLIRGYPAVAKYHRRYGTGYAHRLMYVLQNGPIPYGLELDHLCRMRSCINPAHLEAVTHKVNIHRCPDSPAANNARKTHCNNGHALVKANLMKLKDAKWGRKCLTCHRNNATRYRNKI